MGLDQYAHLRGKNINFEKVYNSNDYDPKEDGFVWRKHARLQTFMNQQWQKQNQREAEKRNKPPTDPMDLSCLGMNAGDEVYITEEVLKELKKAYEEKYYRHFCSDGFFWGQQFQEEAVNEYKGQDKKFIEWCEEAIKRKQTIVYTCSWLSLPSSLCQTTATQQIHQPSCPRGRVLPRRRWSSQLRRLMFVHNSQTPSGQVHRKFKKSSTFV